MKPGILEKGLLLELRFQLDQYINLRPVKLFPGVECPLVGKGPKEIDFVVVRENTEDMYAGIGGFLKKHTADEVATLTTELRPGQVAPSKYGASVGAGTVADQIERYGALADAGVQTAIVRLADVGRKPDAIARFAPVVAAFGEG